MGLPGFIIDEDDLAHRCIKESYVKEQDKKCEDTLTVKYHTEEYVYFLEEKILKLEKEIKYLENEIDESHKVGGHTGYGRNDD